MVENLAGFHKLLAPLEEAMFSLVLVGWFVCLSVCLFARLFKKLWTDFQETCSVSLSIRDNQLDFGADPDLIIFHFFGTFQHISTLLKITVLKTLWVNFHEILGPTGQALR